MKKISILTLLLLSLACSCKNKNSSSDATTATQPSTSNSVPEKMNVKWRFDNKMIDDSEPSCDLYLNVNGKDILVEKGMDINLAEIEPPFDSTDTDKIPNNALLACRGFWAGWDCRMYVRQEGDKLVVFEGAHPEGSDIEEGSEYEGISYRVVKTITAADLK